MSEGPLDWADERVHELAAGNRLGLLAAVKRWLLRRFVPFHVFRSHLAKQVAMANSLAREASELAVDMWVAGEAGIEPEDLPVLPDEPQDDFAVWADELGEQWTQEEARLAKAIDTIFEGEREQLAERMGRLAEAEPIRASKERMRERMKARGVAEYVRVVEPDACDACADRVGELRGVDVPFTDHPGCRCSLRPRVPQGWGDEVKKRALQLRRVSPNGVRTSFGLTFNNIQEERHD